MSALSIDLNCDLGEYETVSQGHKDAVIMAYISSCNIACGAHAGNQAVIEQTVSLALKNKVSMGAHPAYPDRNHFGRKVMQIPAQQLKASLIEQIQSVKAAAENQGARLSHVKPHGALYNQAADDLDLAMLLVEAVREIDAGLMVYGLAHSKMQQAAARTGLVFVAEGFADRAYSVDRTLLPRSEPGAVITDTNLMFEQALQMVKTKQVKVATGQVKTLQIETLCVHGDHSGAMQTARFLHQGLLQAGVTIQAPQPREPA